MTQVVNETDRLTYILTDYGLSRVAEALEDSTVNIFLTKIKVGNANYEYYIPTETITELRNPIPNGEFPIIKKELLEDELTISLRAFIPEKIDNCEIREVGIYETVEGVDKLFAISTQQPIVKPSEDLNYFITVDYYAFLKSQNLASIYDRIVLLPEHQLITKEDFENLMSTILFTESNLMEQINGNSRVIGLNRAQQLKEKIDQGLESFSYITAANVYSLLLNYTTTDGIFGYWLFDYSKKLMSQMGIVDLGTHGRNLLTNKSLGLYNKEYTGLLSTLNFSSPDYFYFPQDEAIASYNPDAFTKEGSPSITIDGVASDFSSESYITGPSLTLENSGSYALRLKFKLTDIINGQSIAYTSTANTLEVFYDPTDNNLKARIGDGSDWLATVSSPIISDWDYDVQVLFDQTSLSLMILENSTYILKDTQVIEGTLATNLGTLTLGRNSSSYGAFSGSIDLKECSWSVNDVRVFSGSTFTYPDNMSLLDPSQLVDAPFAMAFAIAPNQANTNKTLLARSDYSINSHIFEVNETANNALEVKLFTDSENYLQFISSNDMIPNKAHSIVISYEPANKDLKAYLNGQPLFMNKYEIGNYTHMNDTPPILYSYTYIETSSVWANSSTNPTNLYNSDGTPYIGSKWSISEGVVFYNGTTAQYNPEGDFRTDYLYSWVYNDGVYDHTIYTKTLDIEEDTILYEANYRVYTGSEFAIVLSGSDYIIQYNSHDTERGIPSEDIKDDERFCYTFSGGLKTIWANSDSTPTALYDASNNLYEGSEWTLENNVIRYQDGGIASYNSLYNLTIPVVPVTSYVIDEHGNLDKYIDSKVGIISVIRDKLDENELRAIALNLEAAIGNNPCSTTY